MRHISLLTAGCVIAALSSAHAEPALLAYGDKGIRIGATPLYDKAVEGAAYDAAQDLVWFKASGTLHVIDLRQTDRKPVAIATRMPQGGFAIEGISTVGWETMYAGYYPVVRFGKKTGVSTGSGAYGGIWDDQDRTARQGIKKVKLVGKKWLDKQRKRAARKVVRPAIGGLSGKLIKLPEGAGECDGQGAECGDTKAFGDTLFQLVVVSSGCGDACHMSCVLYDPKTQRFVHPLAFQGAWSAKVPGDAAPCSDEDYGLHAGGEYFSGSKRCKVGADVRCTEDAGWTYFGWVD